MTYNRDKEHIKLDETMKKLFNVSKPLLLNVMNYLFKENIDINEDAKVTIGNQEFLKDINLIRGDFFASLTDEKTYFHIEFQLTNQNGMVMRMLEYGMEKGKEQYKYENNENVLYMPKQLVMYLEENGSIPDELVLKIVFPTTDKGKQEVNYIVPTVKAWQFSQQEIMDNELYSLLPLQIFKLRKDIEKLKDADNMSEMESLKQQVTERTKNVISISKDLLDQQKLSHEDFTIVMDSTQYLFSYFNKRYGNEILNKEVEKVATFSSELIYKKAKSEGIEEGIEQGEQQKAIKIAKSLLRKNVPEDIILETTGIEEDKLLEIKQELKESKKKRAIQINRRRER